jgi:tetratricopeptide (TPR) repeat protein
MSADEAELEELIARARFVEAEAYCLERLAHGGDPAYWMTRQAYVCFLNDEDTAAYHDRAPGLFARLAEVQPDDASSLFWHGYLLLMVRHDERAASNRLREVLRLDPDHAYASLVLAGIAGAGDRLPLLRDVLRTQPGNVRALRELAIELERAGDAEGSRRAWSRLVSTDPLVETRLGIMNHYVNDVLTGSTRAMELRAEADARLS